MVNIIESIRRKVKEENHMALCAICKKNINFDATIFAFGTQKKPICMTCRKHLTALKENHDETAVNEAKDYISKQLNWISDPDVYNHLQDMLPGQTEPISDNSENPISEEPKNEEKRPASEVIVNGDVKLSNNRFGARLLKGLAWTTWISGIISAIVLALEVDRWGHVSGFDFGLFLAIALAAFIAGGVLYALAELLDNIAAIRKNSDELLRRMK